MGVSEVLLCPYRCLEYKMERLEKLKIVALNSSINWKQADRRIGSRAAKL